MYRNVFAQILPGSRAIVSLLVCCLLLLPIGAGIAFGQKKVVIDSTSYHPNTVDVGQAYEWYVDVRNKDKTRDARVEVKILITGNDSLITQGWRSTWVGPGKTHRFTFHVRRTARGEGSKIASHVRSDFSDEPKYWVGDKGIHTPDRENAVYRQFKNHHPSRSIIFTIKKKSVVAAPGKVVQLWIGRSDDGLAWDTIPWECAWAKK